MSQKRTSLCSASQHSSTTSFTPITPSLTYNPLVDFGRIPLQSQPHKSVTLNNPSNASLTISFIPLSSISYVRVVPSSISVPAKSSTTIKVIIDAIQKGGVQSFFKLELLESAFVPLPNLEINGIVVDKDVSVYSEYDLESPISSVTLPNPICLSSSFVHSLLVFNGSVGEIKYNISKQLVLDHVDPRHHFLFLTPDFDLKIEPKLGTVDTLQRQDVEITVSPCFSEDNQNRLIRALLRYDFDQFPSSFKICYQLSIATNRNSFLTFPFSFDLILPFIQVLPSYDLVFEPTAMNNRSSIPITLKNTSSLNLVVKFSKIAHFKCEPAVVSIAAQETVSVLVVFQPRQSGSIKGQIRLLVGLNPTELCPMQHFYVSGESFLTPSNQRVATMSSSDPYLLSTVKKPLFKTDPTVIDPLNPYQLPVTEMEAAYQHRTQYIRHLRQSRVETVKNKKEELTRKLDNDTDLGMIPGDGIVPSRQKCLALTEEIGSLEVNKKAREAQRIQRLVNNVDHVISKKFPIKNDGFHSKPLSDSEVELILTGPVEIDFGQVTLGSRHHKSFNLYNSLDFPISCLIDFDTLPLFSQSFKKLQYIPAHSIAGFDIILDCVDESTTGKMTFTPSVLINEIPLLQLNLTVDITPIKLIANPDMISFDILDLNCDDFPFQSKMITLSNPSSSFAQFSLTKSPCFASFSPSSGTIPPTSNTRIKVVFRPDSNTMYSDFAVFKIEKGFDVKVNLMASIAEGNVKLIGSKRVVDFGTVAIGSKSSRHLTLKNESHHPSYFYLSPPPFGVFSISPSCGVISGQSSTQLTCTVDGKGSNSTFNQSLEMILIGQSPIKMSLKAILETPSVVVTPKVVHFSSTVGQKISQNISIANMSDSKISIFIDLSKLPSFLIEIDQNSPHLDSISLEQSANDDQSRRFSTVLVEDHPGDLFLLAPKSTNQINTVSTTDDCSLRLYRLDFNPKSTIDFVLSYSSSTAESLEFSLPIIFEGQETINSDLCHVVVSSTFGRLMVTPSIIDFGPRCVICDDLDVAPTSLYQKSIKVTCTDRIKPVKFAINDSESEPFSITSSSSKSSYVLTYGESMEFVVSFVPKSINHFSSKIKFNLIDDVTNFSVPCKGVSTAPMLLFSPSEIVFPPCPVDTELFTYLEISSVGFPYLCVESRLPPDDLHIPIVVDFVEGQELGVNNPTIKVKIGVKSSRQLSFVGMIDFLCIGGLKFSIRCSGIFDNSLMTVFPFLSRHQSFFKKSKDQSRLLSDPIHVDCHLMTSSNRDYDPILIALGNLPPVQFPFLPVIEEHVTRSNFDMFLTYLSTFCFSTPITNIPDDFFVDDCAIFNQFVLKTTGKNIKSKKTNQSFSPIKFVESALRIFKSHGFLLNILRPEFLLPRDLFIKTILNNLNENFPFYDLSNLIVRSKFEKYLSLNFDRVSSCAWSLLFHQTIKFTTTDKISPKSLSLNHVFNHKSNFLSNHEFSLLTWVNNCIEKVTSPLFFVKNFDFDFKSGIPLSCVLLKYLPFLAPKFDFISRLNTMSELEPETVEILVNSEKNNIAQSIISILTVDLGLNLNILISDLLIPSSRHMIILLSILASILPCYDTHSTIDFPAKLNTKATRKIQVSNPTNRPVSYRVIIHGKTNHFSTIDKLTVDPQSTSTIEIDYLSRFSVSEEAILYIIPFKVNLASPQPLVFALKSIIKSSKPLQKLTIKGEMYQKHDLQFTVTNPFDSAVNLKVDVNQSLVEDLSIPTFQSKTTIKLASDVPAWLLNQSNLFLDKKGSLELNFSFIPLCFGTYSFVLSFLDENVGEFSVEILGVADLPRPSGVVEVFSSDLGQNSEFSISLPFKNQNLESLANSFEHVAAYVSTSCQCQNTITYNVLQNSDAFKLPNQITLNSSKIEKKPIKKGINQSTSSKVNKLSGIFCTQSPVKYTVRLVLLSPFDLRVYTLIGSLKRKGHIAIVEFNCKLRDSITQELPVFNTAQNDDVFEVIFDHPNEWSGPTQVVIPGGSHHLIPVTYKPLKLGKSSSKIVLKSQATKELISYGLIGNCDAPRCEKLLSFEVAMDQPFPLTFPLSPQQYFSPGTVLAVRTDLNCVFGPSSITVSHSKLEYQGLVRTNSAGVLIGSISFVEPTTGNYLWYQLKITSLDQNPEDTIEVVSPCRVASAVTINIHNPLNQTVNFDVDLIGQDLSGLSDFVVPPCSSFDYEFVYLPSRPNQKFEGKIVFKPQTGLLGISYYKLMLQSMQSEVDVGQNRDQVKTLPVLPTIVESHYKQQKLRGKISRNPKRSLI
ncbi:hypothetical protein RCL1_003933 [Eukaryota sp. TZLM3-RCL]